MKIKTVATRKKTSPAIPPPTPVASGPNQTEENIRTIVPAPPVGRASVIPPTQWTEMTGKVTETSSSRAEAPANDAPTFPPIKAKAFDEEGRIKPEFMSRFMKAPRLPDRKSVV